MHCPHGKWHMAAQALLAYISAALPLRCFEQPFVPLQILAFEINAAFVYA